MAADLVVTVRLNDEISGPLREIRRMLADAEERLPKTLCGHCGSISLDDSRGNCSCCGAQRPVPEYKEWRAIEPPDHAECRCEIEFPAGLPGDTFEANAADMIWLRYRGAGPETWSMSLDTDNGTLTYAPR